MFEIDNYESGHEDEYNNYYIGDYDEESIKLWEHEKSQPDLDDVVQFCENHKWCGCLGIVEEVKPVLNDTGEHIDRYMIGVPIPEQGTAYIFCKREDIERIGTAIMISRSRDNNECNN